MYTYVCQLIHVFIQRNKTINNHQRTHERTCSSRPRARAVAALPDRGGLVMVGGSYDVSRWRRVHFQSSSALGSCPVAASARACFVFV